MESNDQESQKHTFCILFVFKPNDAVLFTPHGQQSKWIVARLMIQQYMLQYISTLYWGNIIDVPVASGLTFEMSVEELERLKEKAAKLEVEANERRLRAAEVRFKDLKETGKDTLKRLRL